MPGSSSLSGTDQIPDTTVSGPGGTPPDWQRQIFNDFKNALLQSLDEPLAEVRRWSWFSLVFAGLSVGLLMAGCVTAIMVAIRAPPGTWADPTLIMSLVSNAFAALATTANMFVNQKLDAARKELADRRGQIDLLTSRLFKRLFGESGEPSVVTYAHKDAIAGRFIKVGREDWEEVSFREDRQSVYHFKLSKMQGSRLFLLDVSKPRRSIEVEIDLDFKRILWIDLKTNVQEELYRVLDID